MTTNRHITRRDTEDRYRQLLDTIEQRQRERDLLGPDRHERYRTQFEQQGMTPRQPDPPDAYVKAGGRVRELLAAADHASAQVDRVNARIEELTPEAADEHHRWIWSMMPPGTIPRPDHPDTRPSLDPEVHRTLVEMGILESDPVPTRPASSLRRAR